MDDEECEEGVRCIAVPVMNYQGEVVAGISVSAPITRLNKQKQNEIIAFLKDIGLKASGEMGWKP
jgi:DNA-binding IclR family transcriptional regulator